MGESVIGALRIILGADTAAFEKQMAGLSAKMNAIGKNLAVAGAGLTAGVTLPLLKLGQTSLNAYQDSEKAVAAVDAALKSTGGQSGKTSKQLQDSAAALQKISTFDDDEILSKVTANMLTFGNVSGDAFDRAQMAALDLSTRLGQDLQSSTIQIGKALNDPIKGISSLSRVGVTFTETQKKMIKEMVKTGDMAGAQKMILDELFKEFGGQAEAAAKTSDGAWKQMQNSIGDAMEAIGAVIAPFVTMFADFIKSAAEAFSALDPSIQTFIVALGAVAAAAGPVLLAISALLPALALIGPAIAVIASPVGIVIAAIAALSVALNAMGIDFSTQWEVVKIAFQAVIDGIARQIEFFKALFTGDFAGAFEAVKGIITDTISALANIIDTLFPGLVASMQNQARLLAQAFVELKNTAVQAMADIYAGAKTWLMDKLTAAFDYVANKLSGLMGSFKDAYDYLVGHSIIPDMVTESTDWLKQLGTSMDKIGGDAVSNWNSNMASLASGTASINTSESASVSAANDNATGTGSGRGRGDIYLGGITLNATDYQSFKQSKGQLQNDMADMMRAAMAGR